MTDDTDNLVQRNLLLVVNNHNYTRCTVTVGIV